MPISRASSARAAPTASPCCSTSCRWPIVLFLCHWALIGLAKVYFFGIPEDFLLAASTVPALYLFFREYIAKNRELRTKPDARMLNGLLILLCIVIGLFFTATLLHQIRLYV